ncbi:uncharacterized protein BO95DRAFT_268282 [Aspergillus brunneoviolaceus CBS 621.78]|uniref:Uncharacterized protein n=1 Tax=Aspergillus brunneoviolaceus CBS 621.78 TaxID=1450534 RepID=A0ACD1GJV0_9EURO|nr:hypothetical protein BO95DRAFT_268282 [Aspergillus brunneoviolaceus CBS 621.78]RAH49520.1 hypothetical protein BO95DRAFT_268282 [Aspergillus brunneoviolaceus CBS 621.78]
MTEQEIWFWFVVWWGSGWRECLGWRRTPEPHWGPDCCRFPMRQQRTKTKRGQVKYHVITIHHSPPGSCLLLPLLPLLHLLLHFRSLPITHVGSRSPPPHNLVFTCYLSPSLSVFPTPI